jgi:uncharacterized delta-60 repeat protein
MWVPRRTSLRQVAAVVVGLLVAVGAVLASSASSATSGTIVSVTVPSATELSMVGCAPGVANRTSFGTILPGAAATTGEDCTVAFGSSNDTSSLRVRQADRGGDALHTMPWGAGVASFGTDGLLGINLNAGSDRARHATIQPDGMVVAVGQVANATTDGLVMRLRTDGTPDPLFNGGNHVSLNPSGATDIARRVVIDEAGRIVVLLQGGTTTYVMRLQPNGSPDLSFATGGTWSGPGDSLGLALGADGSAYVAGYTNPDSFVVKLDASGQPDPSWGTAGVASFSASANNDRGHAVAIQPDGRVVVAGAASGANWDSYVARLRTDGSLDPDFGTTSPGVTITQHSLNEDVYFAVALLPDGRIVASGERDVGGSSYRIIAARYSAAGELDMGFAGGMFEAAGAGLSYGVAAQPDGKVLVAGYGYISGSTDMDIIVIRLREDGTPDPTFDGDGYARFDSGDHNLGFGIEVGRDGRVVVAGYRSTTNSSIEIMLLESGTVPDHASGTSDWVDGPGMFGTCLRGVGGGAIASWTTTGTCTAANGAQWRSVPGTWSTIATAPTSTSGAQAHLRFGLRVPTAQRPDAYVAPIQFQVVAPG